MYIAATSYSIAMLCAYIYLYICIYVYAYINISIYYIYIYIIDNGSFTVIDTFMRFHLKVLMTEAEKGSM